ncbi:glucarate dehydratase [Saccharopolyspora erythraea NRRL 2338]|uniref:glucarate dehydratase n=2 Tax=Saccharopolyspora erythraea TaxID=1836 RepID=A4FJ81_SACEN|nr:glucarate dehydratase family protein [Saccharopolyspora erythraea]EQD82932.1 glucarate dehydratase [Saccharopolyspora erythraea D]PFG97776.1 glucarate dehydratase [Saccharopolyspora erythraea NRRL 2338]QRK87920.1 glucarate dehydratase [Saccharopolyspora erythraea]CAM04106.1 mandelate racemase/muconate lactonizing enzyme [Saccharopolyspora erythraea NRRL 2338]
MPTRQRIADVEITPVAFQDPPLLNAVGVHEPFAIRAIVEIRTDEGLSGLGETYGDTKHLERLRRAAELVTGTDVWDLNALAGRVRTSLQGDSGTGGHGMAGMVTDSSTADAVFSPFEVACLDIQGKATGLPVSSLLGGAVRDRIDYSAYLFYKWAGHPGAEPDTWGAALDPDGVVAQARRMIDDYGFSAIKLKGGVFEPDEEIAAIKALAEAFPGMPLRLDPNAAWTVDTSIRVGRKLDGVLEYLEDPTGGIEGMAEVARKLPMPLATNMAVVSFADLDPGIRRNAVRVVLSDHHFWGGLRRSRLLAGICETFGMSLSMHSNSHLGISLAAMTHLAAATPNLTYACDTHWPWKDQEEDVVKPGALTFSEGAVAVPTAPGLGVELDRDKLGALHEQFLRCGIRDRDDTGYMRRIDPAYELRKPRW